LALRKKRGEAAIPFGGKAASFVNIVGGIQPGGAFPLINHKILNNNLGYSGLEERRRAHSPKGKCFRLFLSNPGLPEPWNLN
jgi:hypothetical protein